MYYQILELPLAFIGVITLFIILIALIDERDIRSGKLKLRDEI